MKKISIIILVIFLTSCIYDEGPAEFPAGSVLGYAPVYAEEISTEVAFIANQPLKNPGKIYIYNAYLLINERNLGVHIVDNSIKEDPKLIGFIAIQGNIDIALSENLLIADQLGDLITIDISDITNPIVIDRVVNALSFRNSLPPESNRYFECPDPKREHLIINWNLVQLNDPKCYR